MIAATSSAHQLNIATARGGWQRELAQAISSATELLEILALDPALLDDAKAAGRQFPLRVPRSFVARMRKGDPADPLLLQVLPLRAELTHVAGFVSDPVQDLSHRSAPGLLQKYDGRALLVTTGACAVNCRYCFRRHFPYGDESVSGSQWQLALDQLRADTSVSEVILSGGDPLSLTDAKLQRLCTDLAQIGHLRRLRIHSRYPVVLPERIDAGLLQLLQSLPWQKVMVIHSNHAQELDDSVARACRDLAAAGVTLLNQSVLLAGVNDSADALVDLSEKLFAMGVLPYYLHVLDRVAGAAHFEVEEARARHLMREVVSRLPGYLVPRLVREISGDPSKTPIPL